MASEDIQNIGDNQLQTGQNGLYPGGTTQQANIQSDSALDSYPDETAGESQMVVSQTVFDGSENDKQTAPRVINGTDIAVEVVLDSDNEMTGKVVNQILEGDTVSTNWASDTNCDIPDNSTQDRTNSCHNSLLNDTGGEGKDYRPSRKQVAWQNDGDTEFTVPELDAKRSDSQRHCVNVDPLVQTDLISRSVSPSSPHRNKGLTDPENDLNVVERDRSPSDEEIKGKEPCLTNHEDGQIKNCNDTCDSLALSHDNIQPTNEEKAEGSEDYSSPNLLARRRPLTSNGKAARAGRFWGDKSLSEESLRPASAFAHLASQRRRFSLPLELISAQVARNLCWENKANRTSDSLLSNLDDSAQQIDKQSRKASLVTSTEREQVKCADTPKVSLSALDKPLRPVSSRNTNQGHQRPRPQTAGPGRAGSGRRPSNRRLVRSAPPGMATLRPWELRFSREELQRALPRRNFFNCHTKALKDAGFDTEEENTKPRRRFFFFKREDNTDNTPQTPPASAPPVIHVPPFSTDSNQEVAEDKTSIPNPLLETALETAVSMLPIQERIKRRKANAAPVVIECKPLQHYLSYVNDNPGEYRHMVVKSSTTGVAAALHPSSRPTDNCHTARLVNMGRVFQERHGGDKNRTDEVLRAAYALNPRAADPNRFAKSSRDKSGLVPGLMSRKQPTLPGGPKKDSAASPNPGEDANKSGQRPKQGSESNQKHEAEKLAHTEQLLEVEKRRLKAEEWARTVTTDQLVRAKLQVLKELGHEERELSKWWLAFKTCFYLRPRIRD